MEFIMFFILQMVLAIIGMAMAESRGRSAGGGFLLGFLLGLIGLAIIALMGQAQNNGTDNKARNEIISKIKEED